MVFFSQSIAKLFLLTAEIDSDEDHIIELNGTEEGPYVHAILACLPPQSGFKEGKEANIDRVIEHSFILHISILIIL